MAARNDAPLEKPRRFYRTAAAVEQAGGGFAVVLDGRVAKTPAGGRLVAPTQALADLLAEEWDAQAEVVDLALMPAVRLAFTVIDRGADATAALAAEVARYVASDLLCYFAEGPATLLEHEVAQWSPVLGWAEQTLGLSFVRVTGVIHRPQPPETVARVQALAAALDPFVLTGLAYAAALFGSAVLGFAVQRGMLTGDAAFDLSRLDEAYQEARWGVDAEAAARTAALRRDAEIADRWFAALRG